MRSYHSTEKTPFFSLHLARGDKKVLETAAKLARRSIASLMIEGGLLQAARILAQHASA
jgi:uncharacterized protein (DUF1778 family)